MVNVVGCPTSPRDSSSLTDVPSKSFPSPSKRFFKIIFDTNPIRLYSILTMNNELSAESDLRNMITVDISETMIPEIELTDEELAAADDIRFSDELSAMVAELPVFTDEQTNRYNDKMTMLAAIRADIAVLNEAVTDETESYTVPAGRYDYVYSMGTI